MIHLLSIGALSFYTLSLVFLIFQLLLTKRKATISFLSAGCFQVAYFFHVGLLVPFIFMERYRFLFSGADYFFWLSLSVATAYQIFRQKVRYPVLGVFLLSATLLFMGSSSYLVHSSPLRRFEQSLGFVLSLHVFPAIMAEMCLCIACGVSAVYLVQERRLKTRIAEALSFKGPSLEWLNRISQRALLLGFIAMSIAILTGCIWAYIGGQGLIGKDLSIVVGLLAWIGLFYLQYGRFILHWSARKNSAATVFSTLCIIIALVCIRLILGNIVHGDSRI